MLQTIYPASDATSIVPTVAVQVSGGTFHYIELSRRTRLIKDFFNLVYLQALEGIPLLDHNEPFTAEIVCGDGFWAQLSDWERRQAGRSIVKMLEYGLLPFVPFVKSPGCRTKWYRIPQPLTSASPIEDSVPNTIHKQSTIKEGILCLY